MVVGARTNLELIISGDFCLSELQEIMAIFDNFCPNLHLMDKFIWVAGLAVGYSVKSG